MKIHWCCGDVYLDGYQNIDIHGLVINDATPEQIEANKTQLTKYYKYPFIENDSKRAQHARPFIVDQEANIMEKWPFEEGSISGIVLVNAVEHFTKSEFAHIITEINRVASPGCEFTVSFPDVPGIISAYYSTNPDYCMTLIYCNWKNQYSVHKTGFSAKSFTALFPKWSFVTTDIINHDYPNIQLFGVKVS